MDEKKNTSKSQITSKATDTVAETSPLYDLYAYLTLLGDNIPSLCGASQDQLSNIADQIFKDLNDLQQSISKLPPDHCFTTKPIVFPMRSGQLFSLTPDAECVFLLFKACLELTCTHLKAAPETEKSYPDHSKQCDFVVQRNIHVYATARRLFHCLAHALSKQSLTNHEASIANFLHIISDDLIANLPQQCNLFTVEEHSRLISITALEGAKDWAEALCLNCPDFNDSICSPLEDAIQLGWQRGIEQLVSAGYQLLGDKSLYTGYKSLSKLPGWGIYQQLLADIKQKQLANQALHKTLYTTLRFFPKALTAIVYDYSKEEAPEPKSTSGCNLM